MLGQPTLLATHGRGDAQCIALLAQQGITAIARANAPDGARLWKMGDEATIGRQIAERMQTRHPVGAARVEPIQGDLAHAGHDAHVGDDVRAIGDLDADLGVWRSGWAHDVRHDVHRSALHAVVEQRPDALAGVLGAHPVVGRPGILGVLGTDKSEVLGAGDVLGIGAVEEAVRQRVAVEPDQGAVRDHLVDEPVVFGIGSIAPDDAIWVSGAGDLIDPGFDGRRHWHPPCVNLTLAWACFQFGLAWASTQLIVLTRSAE